VAEPVGLHGGNDGAGGAAVDADLGFERGRGGGADNAEGQSEAEEDGERGIHGSSGLKIELAVNSG
jgi:hypothetical protein